MLRIWSTWNLLQQHTTVLGIKVNLLAPPWLCTLLVPHVYAHVTYYMRHMCVCYALLGVGVKALNITRCCSYDRVFSTHLLYSRFQHIVLSNLTVIANTNSIFASRFRSFHLNEQQFDLKQAFFVFRFQTQSQWLVTFKSKVSLNQILSMKSGAFLGYTCNILCNQQ